MKCAHLKSRCTVCRHAERARIELLRIAGVSLDTLASQFGLSRDAVHRHMAKHVTIADKAAYLADVPLSELMARAADDGLSLLDFMRIVRATLTRQFQLAASVNDHTATAALAGRLNETLGLIGKLTGELLKLAPGMTINNTAVFIESPQFAQVHGVLLKALAPHPEARAAVVSAVANVRRRHAAASHRAR
jgi:hypothetical protein